MKKLFIFIFLANGLLSYSQEASYTSTEIPISKFIDGTLLTPNDGAESLAIILAGSGPTDRDGNQNFLKTNNLKKLAVALTNNGIATFRYDKRIVKQIRKGSLDPNIKFDDFVTDAIATIDYFKAKNNFKKIYIIGHSQGSLVGLLAAKDKAHGFISLAGAGQTIDKVITEQVQKTAPMFIEDTKRVFGILKEGKTTTEYPPALASIFDISVQKFIANWMSYDPVEEIKKLDIPILVINGTKDLQVSVEEAKLLNDAGKNSELKLIEKMNHVLFIIEGDDLENSKSYNDHAGKVSSELIETIISFIKK
ncbi:lysophospholipase [Subsaxibacter sp. CAU 1640]|uniref:alpha/beta hydrolase n=1 Tax=Subsaxibacter sp. CAU 1640 TaxID=2933271 RepID=UPI002003A7B2|nr:alpha/beta fold hydrolase [Subsaxibacter sp. CAU 1640]MCK7590021.1 lysophospholipase [Subsaxibacter sp. CAU 1640]